MSIRKYWPAALFIAAELFLYLSYQHNDGRFHWFLHFFVGASAALLVMAARNVSRRGVVGHPLLWIFAGHIVSMMPDILWNFQIVPHQPWMDVFLLHIEAHFIPGRNWTWYTIFLACLALYFFAGLRLNPKHAKSRLKAAQENGTDEQT